MEHPLGNPAQPVSPQSAGSASREDDCADAGTGVKSADASDLVPDKTAPSTAEDASQERLESLGDSHALTNGAMNGGSGTEGSAHINSSPASTLAIPAEEEAFLRSLGWEESDDHNEGAPSTSHHIVIFRVRHMRLMFFITA